MPEDKFNSYAKSLSGPLTKLEVIAPSDSEDLQDVTRAVNVAVSGAVTVTTVEGDTGTITVAAGISFPIRITRVWASGTTALGIVGLS